MLVYDVHFIGENYGIEYHLFVDGNYLKLAPCDIAFQSIWSVIKILDGYFSSSHLVGCMSTFL